MSQVSKKYTISSAWARVISANILCLGFIFQAYAYAVNLPEFISVGNEHTCAIKPNTGTVNCWGNLKDFRLGVNEANANSTAVAGNRPVAIGGPVAIGAQLSGATIVGAGLLFSCAAGATNPIGSHTVCWGKGAYNGTTTSTQSIWVLGLPAPPTALKVWGMHSALAVSNSRLYFVPFSLQGSQTANGTSYSTVQAIEVTSIGTGITQLDSADSRTCVVKSGALYCTTSTPSAQMFSGTAGTTPVQGLTSGVASVSLSGENACVVQNGAAKCWGPEVGDAVPTVVNGGSAQVTDVKIAKRSSPLTYVGCSKPGILYIKNNSLYALGCNRSGILGVGATGAVFTTAQQVPLSGPVTAVSMGNGHSCAWANGQLKCWGLNEYGQVNPTQEKITVLEANATSLVASGGFTGFSDSCAKNATSTRCWGYNKGEGNALLTSSSSAVHKTAITLTSDSGVSEISATKENSISILNGSIVTRPSVVSGLSGQSAQKVVMNDSPSLVVTGNNQTSLISPTHYFFIQNGSLKSYGNGSWGLLGIGSDFSGVNGIVQQVSGMTSGVTEVKTARQGACAIQTGALKCWGTGVFWNQAWQPQLVSGLTANVTKVAMDWSTKTMCAIQNGGVKCWGERFGTGTSFDTVVSVPGLETGVTDIAFGGAKLPRGGFSNFVSDYLFPLYVVQNGALKKLTYTTNSQGVGANTLSSTPFSSGVTAIQSIRQPWDGNTLGISFYSTLCFLTSGGAVRCFGDNYANGFGSTMHRNYYLSIVNAPAF